MKIDIDSFKVYEDKDYQPYIIAKSNMRRIFEVKLGLKKGIQNKEAREIAKFLSRNIKNVSL